MNTDVAKQINLNLIWNGHFTEQEFNLINHNTQDWYRLVEPISVPSFGDNQGGTTYFDKPVFFKPQINRTE